MYICILKKKIESVGGDGRERGFLTNVQFRSKSKLPCGVCVSKGKKAIDM